MCTLYSKLTIKTPNQLLWPHFPVLIVTFEHIPYIVLLFFAVKRDPAEVFSCEFREIFNNIFFHRTPPGDCFGCSKTPSCEILRQFLVKEMISSQRHSLHRKWSFPLRIFSVNVTKSAGNYGFAHIHWKNW